MSIDVIINLLNNATTMINNRYYTYTIVYKRLIRELNLPRVSISTREIKGVNNQKSTIGAIT